MLAEQAMIASYGTWQSPITAEIIAEGVTSISNIRIDGSNTYWCEMRPLNKGRYTIVKRDVNGKTVDITPSNFNARTFVHEYGGGAFAVANDIVYTSCATDGKIYYVLPGQEPVPLTDGQISVEQASGRFWKGTRFADMQVTSNGIVAVGEDHLPGQSPENFLALIDTSLGSYKILDSGYDFYSSPAISRDEKHIAWICWNHPEMPWTNTELWVASIDPKGGIYNKKQIAGFEKESIFQPQWSPDGTLYFVTDKDRGWWNLHRYQSNVVENICPMKAEVAVPLWNFDQSTYAFLGKEIIFTYNIEGSWHLGVLDPATNKWNTLQRDGISFQQLRTGNNCVQFLEGYSTKMEALVQIDLQHNFSVLEEKAPLFSDRYLSKAEHISYPSNDRTAFGYYYPPYNQDYKAPSDEKPPLVVMIHGGPTAQARGSFALSKQYWTSQGFAVLDVNYGGSTGYGRPYRNLLNLNWGIVDVEDCVNGAIYLAKKGLVDSAKLLIRGGSAGGYTTLAALAFQTTFAAGADYYGVADITALANDTHKFEQRYMDGLVGEYPKEKAIWEARSPINSVDKISKPLIIFQGEDDPIVPKNQSIMIFDALKKRNIPVEIHIYPGEEHGFRQAPHIIHSLKREADFYREVLKLN